jgi:hypothetical protein
MSSLRNPNLTATRLLSRGRIDECKTGEASLRLQRRTVDCSRSASRPQIRRKGNTTRRETRSYPTVEGVHHARSDRVSVSTQPLANCLVNFFERRSDRTVSKNALIRIITLQSRFVLILSPSNGMIFCRSPKPADFVRIHGAAHQMRKTGACLTVSASASNRRGCHYGY